MIRARCGLLGLMDSHLKRSDRFMSNSNASPIAEDVSEPVELITAEPSGSYSTHCNASEAQRRVGSPVLGFIGRVTMLKVTTPVSVSLDRSSLKPLLYFLPLFGLRKKWMGWQHLESRGEQEPHAA